MRNFIWIIFSKEFAWGINSCIFALALKDRHKTGVKTEEVWFKKGTKKFIEKDGILGL